MSSYPTTVLQSRGSERLLLDEFSHRLINELTAAVGMIDLAALRAKTTDARHTLETVRDSLVSLADVHKALHAPRLRTRIDARLYFQYLCDALRKARLQHRGIELQLLAQTLLIDSDKCWRLGMIVVELITNSANHAFRRAPGTIKVDIRGVGATVRCHVEDDGSSRGLPVQPGTGLSIVNALARELAGTFDQRFHSSGSVSTLTFELQ